MNVSVICSTYNQPKWLENVLVGYLYQQNHDFELLIADDGSARETADLIRRYAADAPFPIRHIWHEDRGYRRSIVLNHAVVASEGDWLVFVDGDCIPRHDFVETHRSLAEPGHFLSGGAVYLNEEASHAITHDDIASGRFATASFLRDRGFDPGRRAFRLTHSARRAALYDLLTPTKATFNLNNSSVGRDSVFEANGFEAEMQYGGADRAFGERLMNMGLTGIQARHRAVMIHLDHGRPYKHDESIRRNHAIRDRIAENSEVRAYDGIAELEGGPEPPPGSAEAAE